MWLKCNDCAHEGLSSNVDFFSIKPPRDCLSTLTWYHRACADEGDVGGICEELQTEEVDRATPDDSFTMLRALRWVVTRCIESVQVPKHDGEPNEYEYKNYLSLSLVEARIAQIETALMDYQTDQEKRLNSYSRHDPGDGPSGRSRHD